MIMSSNNFNSTEEQIIAIIETCREEAFRLAKEQMANAFDQIGNILKDKGMRDINKRKLNGISPQTIKEVHNLYYGGGSVKDVQGEISGRWFIEFIKAQSLSYQMQKSLYPNFLKPWKKEDDEMLESMWCEGISQKEIAKALGRHPNSISIRAAKLELDLKYQ